MRASLQSPPRCTIKRFDCSIQTAPISESLRNGTLKRRQFDSLTCTWCSRAASVPDSQLLPSLDSTLTASASLDLKQRRKNQSPRKVLNSCRPLMCSKRDGQYPHWTKTSTLMPSMVLISLSGRSSPSRIVLETYLSTMLTRTT